MTWEVLCKCSGKYIDICFNLKITCFDSIALHNNFSLLQSNHLRIQVARYLQLMLST